MHAFSEFELLRMARVRAEIRRSELGWIDTAELSRAAAQARGEAIAAKLRQVGRVLGRTFARFAGWRRYRSAVAELQGLDIRTLSDIGITRADIPRVAAGLWMPEPAPAPAQSEIATPSNQNARKAAA